MHWFFLQLMQNLYFFSRSKNSNWLCKSPQYCSTQQEEIKKCLHSGLHYSSRGLCRAQAFLTHKEHALDTFQPPQNQSYSICREQESMWQIRGHSSPAIQRAKGVLGHHFISNQNRKSHWLPAFSHKWA